MSDDSSELDRLEFELTLFSRHYLGSITARRNQTLDRSAYAILSRLELDDPLSLRELSVAFRLDVSTVNRQVHAMLGHGLVEQDHVADGGARKFRATEAGVAALHGDREASRAGLARVVEQWGSADLAELTSLMERFNRSIENLEGSRWPRPAKRSTAELTQE